MIESILSLICWVWLPVLLVSLHHSAWRQQSRLLWMNWVSARGYEMALIPLWCHSRDKEKRESFMRPPIHPSVSLSLALSAVPTPAPLVLSWVHITGWWLILPPTQSPLTHPRCSLAIVPSPALPCPALLVPAPWTLAPVAKIPISRPRSGAQAKKAANLVHVCVCVFICVSV